MTNLVLQAAAGGSSMSFLIMMVAIFAIMWFFMIRPQQKKQKEIRKFQNALAEGTKVVTGGGVYGTVKRVDLEANTVDVEIARGVVITVAKGYVFADAASQTPNEGTEKVSIFKDQNGKCLRFITSPSTNRLSKAILDRKRRVKLRFLRH